MLRTSGIAALFALAILPTQPLALAGEETARNESAAAEPAAEPRARLDQFFSLLGRDRVQEACGLLLSDSPLFSDAEDREKLQTRIQKALDSFGVPAGYELLEDRTVGTALRRFTCLALNEQLPLRWQFYFYRTSKGWKLIDLRVDDGIVELFEQTTKR